LADLARGGVAAGLHLLRLGGGRAAALVERGQALGIRRQPPARGRPGERGGVVPNPPKVMHDWRPRRGWPGDPPATTNQNLWPAYSTPSRLTLPGCRRSLLTCRRTAILPASRPTAPR